MKSRIWEKTIAPVWASLWVAEVGVDVLFFGEGMRWWMGVYTFYLMIYFHIDCSDIILFYKL